MQATVQSERRVGEHKPTSRGGATSPSAISTSTEDEGGVRLGARMASLALELSSPDRRYTPPRTDRGNGNSHLTPSRSFQVGNVPGDGDVFDSPKRTPEGSISNLHVSGQSGAQITSVFMERYSPPITEESLIAAGYEHKGLNPYPPGMRKYEPPVTHVVHINDSDLSSRHQVGGVDAQSFYPPTACVFVANLPESIDDTRLEAEVTRQFSKFGVVFVKIRRDNRNMPFAFCQYTRNQDAQVALVQGKGCVIHGRGCRTEMVRANRTYIMHRLHGGDLDLEEARETLDDSGLGPFDKCEPLDRDVQESLGLGKSVLVQLKKFDPAKDLQAAYRHHPNYRVIPYDSKKSSQHSRADADEAWLQRYEVDRRSIFIGNLPYGDDRLEKKIREVAEDIGDVLNVQVIQKDGRHGPSTFSFVEFARPDMADIALERLAVSSLFGRHVRVERKASREANGGYPRRLRAERYGGEIFPSFSDRHFQSRMRESPRHYASESPMTPLRAGEIGGKGASLGSPEIASGLGSLPDSGLTGLPWNPFTAVGSPNYTTSPYTVPCATPGASPFVASPHANAHTMATPYGYYPASAYSWATPYLADPTYAPLAFAHSYGQVPLPFSRSGGDSSGTPTKTSGRGEGEEVGDHGDTTV
ncbi:hypothetical protein BX600DRAFT_550747 [Xylariales sp. PMI_506]|nr:hypothetical protein BX600DRAFT_550747 [Xylariales sp. PMI_506]